jgi:hypothetical protein
VSLLLSARADTQMMSKHGNAAEVSPSSPPHLLVFTARPSCS